MITHGFKKMMADANAVIDTVSVSEAQARLGDDDVIFVDVREKHEREKSGHIAGSLHAPRGFLEAIADPEGPLHKAEMVSGKHLILYCGSGGRSALAAKTLLDMGMGNLSSMAGGFAAWLNAQGPVEK
jgi:rhodanese-related sulfurtransferase